jgi:DNA-binding transcriptional LysR family regulator
MSPSTTAKAVARLEAALGVKLFHRTTRQVTLTPDGERLFQRCQRVLAEVEDLQAEASGTRAEPRARCASTCRCSTAGASCCRCWPTWPGSTRG